MRPDELTPASIPAPDSFADFENMAGMLFYVKVSVFAQQVLKPGDFSPHFFQRHTWKPVTLKFGPPFRFGTVGLDFFLDPTFRRQVAAMQPIGEG